MGDAINRILSETEQQAEEAAKKYPGPTEFVHLHNHTIFSPLDGIATPDEYFDGCKARGWPAFAITDHGNMAAVPDAYFASKRTGVQQIVGCEIYFNDYHSLYIRMKEEGISLGSLKEKNPELRDRITRNRHLTVLAMNDNGYKNLVKLMSRAWDEGAYYGRARIWFKLLKEFSDDLIVLSGCLNGPVCHELRHKNYEGGIKWIKKMRDVFGDRFYLEFQMPGEEIEGAKDAFRMLFVMSRELGIKGVNTNDCLEAGYPILMADGSYEEIMNIKPGDMVITHLNRARPVVAVGNRDLREGERTWRINKHKWSMTGGHPLYIEGQPRHITTANSNPQIGQTIYGQMAPLIWHETNYEGPVYDIEVDEDHSFVLWGGLISHNCHYSTRRAFELQMVMMAVAQRTTIDDPELFHVNSDEQFFKTRAELRQTFFEQGFDKFMSPNDYEKICDNTLEIASRCEPFNPDLSPKLPNIPNADGVLRRLVAQSMIDKGVNRDDKYIDRVRIELDRIIEKGYSSYFLIIRDLIEFSKNNKWMVGPGRGSVGGSLVSYLIGIHDLDPIKWGLSFDRFLSESRGGKMLIVTM